MTSLLILATVLFLVWAWALWERDRRAAFMRPWLHVPFVGAVTCVLMSIGLWIR